MITTLRTYSQHTLIGILGEGVPAVIHTVSSTVNRIALNVLAQVIVSIPLFYLHHNWFAFGFVVGFACDRYVREIVDKVNLVYSAKRNSLEKVIFFGGGGFLAILTMPTSMIIATLYHSALWGAHLYQTNLAYHQKHKQKADAKEVAKTDRPKVADNAPRQRSHSVTGQVSDPKWARG